MSIFLKYFCLFIGLNLVLSSCQNSQGSTPLSEENEAEEQVQIGFSIPFEMEIDRNTLEGDTLITISNDLTFKKSMQYRAFPLKANLEKQLPDNFEKNNYKLVFRCVDGYAPSMPLNLIDLDLAYLAYKIAQDDTLKGDWPDSIASKYAPFYLVWTEDTPGIDQTWPYGVFQLDIIEAETEYDAAKPMASQFEDGFVLFQKNCIKCHAINGEGGQLGPELNYPKNISEYWKKEDIWAFVQNPQSFRYNSRMPAVPDLEKEEFDLIYEYLTHIKTKKQLPD